MVFLADPSHDWRNTIATKRVVPARRYYGGAELATAMTYRVIDDHGFVWVSFVSAGNEYPVIVVKNDEAMMNAISIAMLTGFNQLS